MITAERHELIPGGVDLGLSMESRHQPDKSLIPQVRHTMRTWVRVGETERVAIHQPGDGDTHSRIEAAARRLIAERGLDADFKFDYISGHHIFAPDGYVLARFTGWGEDGLDRPDSPYIRFQIFPAAADTWAAVQYESPTAWSFALRD